MQQVQKIIARRKITTINSTRYFLGSLSHEIDSSNSVTVVAERTDARTSCPVNSLTNVLVAAGIILAITIGILPL